MSEDYHMIRYIHEGPLALKRTLEGNESGISAIAEQVRRQGIRRVILTGLGSSYAAALMAGPVFLYYCPLPVTILPASELSYYQKRLLTRDSLLVVISRSGERGVVVDALVDGINRGAFGVAITGVSDNLLAQQSQVALVTQEGPEITFPKTKSVLGCAGLLMRMGLALASASDLESKQCIDELLGLPGAISDTIKNVEPVLAGLMPVIEKYSLLAVAGSGSNIGVAWEAAIKIQEAAYIPTRGDSTISLIHGPTGALNGKWLVMPLVTRSDSALSMELLKLTRKFGAGSLSVQEPGIDLEDLSDFCLQISKEVNPFLSALIYLPVIHLLAYYWTVRRGMNPDAPSSMRAILDSILPPGREEPELRERGFQ